MLAKSDIQAFLDNALADTDCFTVDIKVTPANDITIEIDSSTSIDIDYITELSRKFEETFPRDVEDYSLEIGSAGLTAPFKVKGQWLKNVGNEIDMLTTDGRKMTATLDAVNDDDTVTVSYSQKVKHEGAKRPVIETVTETIPLSNIKKAEYHLVF
ncbi:MAG: ribosome assembly cofactor RimP [Muribaculaceae bacterium]|nr:ribosome assembly cofactor RimP [Muribaculaceae bacterium]MDE6296093.1 ribosome assembly cofactor RimP [Muribaculaceae bacterium]